MEIAPKTTAALVIGVAIVSFAAGAWRTHFVPGRPEGAGATRRILYYRDPMHPAYKSDKPGSAPDCGMELEPVYADDPTAGAGEPATAPSAPGAVRISAEKQQLMGVRVSSVSAGDAEHVLRIPGRVAADEGRL